ncbi:MAG TPA: CrcB family protein [Candidatus Binatia bacterium]|nr:CrcB family protein [Candidatus Binatia bacterium]
MKAILLVGTGGFVGSVLRYLISGWVFRILDKPFFPAGTLTVNVIGCLVIGFLGGIAEQRRIFDAEFRLFVHRYSRRLYHLLRLRLTKPLHWRAMRT